MTTPMLLHLEDEDHDRIQALAAQRGMTHLEMTVAVLRAGIHELRPRIVVAIAPGAFMGKRAVHFDLAERRVYLLADESEVSESDSTLRVDVLDERDDELLVKLPPQCKAPAKAMWLPRKMVQRMPLRASAEERTVWTPEERARISEYAAQRCWSFELTIITLARIALAEATEGRQTHREGRLPDTWTSHELGEVAALPEKWGLTVQDKIIGLVRAGLAAVEEAGNIV